MLAYQKQNDRVAPVSRYAAYINGLCQQYANQLSIPSDEIDGYAQNIKPIMTQLVYCTYSLIKCLSLTEMGEIYQSLEKFDKKEFCISVYTKYQEQVKDNSMVALETLFYTLLLRDFYTGDFGKISLGGNFGPIILELTRLCRYDQPYDVLCNFIYFPEDEVPYIDSLGVQILIDRCQKAVVPDNFNMNVFTQIVHYELKEIINTIYNIVAKEEKYNTKDKNKLLEDTVPLSWAQTYMTPKKKNEGLSRKTVTFDDSPTNQGIKKGKY